MSESIEKRLAIFSTIYGSEVECGEWAEGHKNYSRITEFVTISFPRTPTAEFVKNKLESLNRAESELREKLQQAIDVIENERAKLLSLPNLTENPNG